MKTLPESISDILLQVFMLGGVVVALAAWSYVGNWLAFPITWCAVMVAYFLIDRLLLRRRPQ
ncbi:hypothetical protein [Marinobacter sp. LN3S78]|uniref:hypothetical protein n=1 Tax=Marinobacter sp. LN3S78 TaxID=3382300 RepID=UPI00387B4BE2